MLRNVLASARLMAAIPAIGIFVASVVLMADASLNLVGILLNYVTGGDRGKLAFEALEIVDQYLIAIIFFMVAQGLYTLFIDDSLPLPRWMRFRDLDDLKARLIGVILLVLAINFVTSIEADPSAIGTLLRGIGFGAILLPLAWITIARGHGQEPPDASRPPDPRTPGEPPAHA